jgi:dimethylargininase
MFTRAIVRPPAANFSEGLSEGLGAPDYEKARQQHEAYCEVLERCGLALERLPPDPQYPDSTFVEDAAVLAGTIGSQFAILARPGAISRRDEVTSIRQALRHFFPSSAILAIESPGTLDGGDVCEADDHFFIGISERTNEDGARQLAKMFEHFGFTSSLVDIQGTGIAPVTDAQSPHPTMELLHLKSGVAYLGDRRLAITEALADREEFRGYDLVVVDRAEDYAANCVKVNDYVLVADGYPQFRSTLQGLGYQTISLEMSEFQKMDGGLSCLSLRF